MKNSRCFYLALVVAVGVSLAGTTFAGAKDAAAATITVTPVKKGLLASPASAAWKSVPQAGIEVTTAFATHPYIIGKATATELKAQAAKSGDELFIRLQWKDSTADRQRGIGQFADAVAVEFATNGSAKTLPYMGGGGQRVNIWYWNASKNNVAQNLVADGFGTLTYLPAREQDVKASGNYANGTWTVVFHRALKTQWGDNVTLAIKSGTKLPMAFAVWNGSNAERDGFKAVTMKWQGLKF